MILTPASKKELNTLREFINNSFGQNVFEKIKTKFIIYKSREPASRTSFFLSETENTTLNELAHLFKTSYSIGYPFIELQNNNPTLNLAAIQVISQFTENRIKVTDKAIELFLYGRDIFKNSIIEFEKNLDKNEYAVITDTKRRPFGIGKLLYSYNELKKLPDNTVAIKNILDIGLYLRCENQSIN
ncbi:MAG: PUA domain-containing protein [Candidatus Odinarchaeota archaeon]